MDDRPVYSTDPDFCPACRISPCACAGVAPAAPAGAVPAGTGADPSQIKKRQPHPLRLSFTRSAKGSGMTVLEGLILHPTLKEELLSRFKKRLGCGGTIKDGNLELQGDRRDFLEGEFKSQGYKVKRIGG